LFTQYTDSARMRKPVKCYQSLFRILCMALGASYTLETPHNDYQGFNVVA